MDNENPFYAWESSGSDPSTVASGHSPARTPRISVLGPERRAKDKPSRRCCSMYSTWQNRRTHAQNQAHHLESER
ncbi:unnamed protein product [Ectocarpus fasciculatus]